MDKIRYKQSAMLLQRAKKVLAGGVSSEFRKYNHPHALFYTHGEGSRIWDVDGNVYIDFTLSQGPLLLGHSHPGVLAAVAAYSAQGQLFAGQHIKEVELAEKLNALIPSAELIRFCLDGSEAVQTALRVARSKTGKSKFLRFEGHYHGWLDNVAYGISATGVEAMGSREKPRVTPWCAGLAAQSRDEFILLPWNDLSLLEAIIKERHDELAAVITEPIMCNNGCILPVPGFLEGLRALCDTYQIALIFDEVITGFRLGLGGAQEHFSIQPDLAIFAKAIGSGYPISAVVGRQSWMAEIEEGRVIHAGTMNSSHATVAAALATIEILEEDPTVYVRLFQLGKQLQEGLKEAARDTGHSMLVQGPGPMLHTAFTDLSCINDYRDTLQTDGSKLKAFIAGLHDEGIRVIGRGLWYISAVHTEEDVKQAIEVAHRVLSRL
ncbi:aspartate aminotransferase family protein [Olivibacter sp. SDN3]|nr:aspartate aminotransferase family protein [Olivibacter sp. SDN3]